MKPAAPVTRIIRARPSARAPPPSVYTPTGSANAPLLLPLPGIRLPPCIEDADLGGQAFNLHFQIVVLGHLAAQKGVRDVDLLLDPFRREDVNVCAFVLAVAEVPHLDEAPLH